MPRSAHSAPHNNPERSAMTEAKYTAGQPAERHNIPTLLRVLAALLCAFALAACADDDQNADTPDNEQDHDHDHDDDDDDDDDDDHDHDHDDEEIEIAGDYVDNFGGMHQVDSEQWVMGFGESMSIFMIASFDNDARLVLAENDGENEFNPGLFSAFEWLYDGDDLYFCQSVFDAASLDAAATDASADAEDLDNGCGGFGWSQLLPSEL